MEQKLPEYLQKTFDFSEKKIEQLRNILHGAGGNEISIVTCGSFARREASDQSDLDYVILTKNKIPEEQINTLSSRISAALEELGIANPSSTGAFGAPVTSDDMLENIGGNNDQPIKLTQRLLFLLESEWLSGKEFHRDLLEKIIHRYVKDEITQHQMCRFLLNDLIRYYRTICVDFEYKTHEESKPWGCRNIKLLFSRKLLYFSGILTIAETIQHTAQRKREILIKNFSQTPIQRISDICGDKSKKALKIYEDFLRDISTKEVRDMLDENTADRNSQSDEFRNFKNRGHHFTWELSRLLAETYDISHPIHLALKF